MGRLAELFEKKANGTITDAELKEYDQLIAEAKSLSDDTPVAEVKASEDDAAIDDLAQKLADETVSKIQKGLEPVMNAIETKTVVEDVVDNTVKFVVDPRYGKKSFEEAENIKIAVPGRETKTHKEVSLKTVHFVNALIEGDKQKLQLLVEGTGSRGGYLVPEEFANMIVEDARDAQIMRAIAAPAMTISGDTLHLPNLASRPKAKFRSEAAVKNTSTVDFGETVFTPYSLAVIVGLSNELAADASLGVSGSIVNYVANLMAVSLAEREDKAFWVGGGSGEPTGVNNYSLRTVAAGGVTDAARADAIIGGYHRTPQGYRNRGVWVGNMGTWEAVARLKDNDGNYLLSSLANSPTPTLRGRPVYEQNDLPGGVLFFGDFGYYQIVDREGISVRISDEATVSGESAFEQNLTYVRVEKRVDGELTLSSAITKVSGLGTI